MGVGGRVIMVHVGLRSGAHFAYCNLQFFIFAGQPRRWRRGEAARRLTAAIRRYTVRKCWWIWLYVTDSVSDPDAWFFWDPDPVKKR